MMSTKKLPLRIGVGAIVLSKKNQVFVGKRKDNPVDKWQMPQGGVNEGEDLTSAMKRELNEELELNATVKDFIDKVEHDYEDFSIIMHCFLVQLKEFSGTLNEHTEYRDISLSEAGSLDWIAADRPILEILKSKFNHVFTG